MKKRPCSKCGAACHGKLCRACWAPKRHCLLCNRKLGRQNINKPQYTQICRPCLQAMTMPERTRISKLVRSGVKLAKCPKCKGAMARGESACGLCLQFAEYEEDKLAHANRVLEED